MAGDILSGVAKGRHIYVGMVTVLRLDGLLLEKP